MKFITKIWTLVSISVCVHDSYAAIPKILPLSHCSKISTTNGYRSEENLDTNTISVSTVAEVRLNQGEKLCLRASLPREIAATSNDTENSRGQENLLVYEVIYLGTRQSYPIRQRYTFAVPQIKSKCICDCPGGENHCPVGYNYRNCTRSSSYCVTTYHAHQKAAGCLTGYEAELCCDVTLTPYKNKRYEAVQLAQPVVTGIFSYSAYVVTSNNGWTLRRNETFEVPLNRDHQVQYEQEQLEIQIGGGKHHSTLLSGMYFYENVVQMKSTENKNVLLYTGVPLNEPYEWNIGKLGWFRQVDGKWTVANGWVEVQDAHHLQVENCKEQKYGEIYKAHYYNSNCTLGFTLGATVQQPNRADRPWNSVQAQEPWIDRISTSSITTSHSAAKAASIVDDGADIAYREITVTVKDPPSVELRLILNSRLDLSVLYKSSALDSFSASIRMDKHSNKYLTLTFNENGTTSGTLIGSLYRDERMAKSDLAFSIYLMNTVEKDNQTARSQSRVIFLPSTIDSARFLCIYPNDKPKNTVCKWAQLDDKPLDYIDMLRIWTNNQGECRGCNDLSWKSFWTYLNPKHWFDGVNSFTEGLAMISEIAFYFVVLLLIILFVRKCLMPVLNYTLCSRTSRKFNEIMKSTKF